MNSKFKDFCIDILSHVRPQATFLSVREYHNNFGEVANFSICFHADYLNAVRKAKIIVENYIPSTDIEEEAKSELLYSFSRTLGGYNPLYTCNGVYEDIIDRNGKPIPGIKLHTNQDIVHINGLRTKPKTVLIKGMYPNTTSQAKTIAKRMIRAKTPLSRWVQFKLEPNRFKELIVQNMRILG